MNPTYQTASHAYAESDKMLVSRVPEYPQKVTFDELDAGSSQNLPNNHGSYEFSRVQGASQMVAEGFQAHWEHESPLLPRLQPQHVSSNMYLRDDWQAINGHHVEPQPSDSILAYGITTSQPHSSLSFSSAARVPYTEGHQYLPSIQTSHGKQQQYKTATSTSVCGSNSTHFLAANAENLHHTHAQNSCVDYTNCSPTVNRHILPHLVSQRHSFGRGSMHFGDHGHSNTAYQHTQTRVLDLNPSTTTYTWPSYSNMPSYVSTSFNPAYHSVPICTTTHAPITSIENLAAALPEPPRSSLSMHTRVHGNNNYTHQFSRQSMEMHKPVVSASQSTLNYRFPPPISAANVSDAGTFENFGTLTSKMVERPSLSRPSSHMLARKICHHGERLQYYYLLETKCIITIVGSPLPW